MCENIKLKIVVISNTPSNEALKNFQKMLCRLHGSSKSDKIVFQVQDKKVVIP